MLSKFYHQLPLLFLCVALAAVALLDTSCTKWQLRRANKNYTQQAYSRAAKKYVKVLPKLKRPQQPEVLFRLAESNRLVGNLQQAETYYSRILRLAGDNVNPNVYLGLAKVQQQAEKYSLAVENYDRYLLLAPLDSLHLSDRELCIALRDSTATATRYMVDNVRDFNSSKDDYAPCFAEDDGSLIFFTSSRDEATGRKPNIVTGSKSTDIFFAKQQRSGKWEKEQLLPGEVNSKAEEGACALSPNLHTLYFTQCIMRGGKVGCSICTATREDEAVEWQGVTSLELDSLYNVAHPSLSEDGSELFFASDMEGGYGGFDIWVVSRTGEGEAWGSPTNMGPAINTAGNEMFPFCRNDAQLYFSSDGHAGFGGLDIFKATRTEGQGWKVENMGLPINSAADDISIIFERDRESGYFASQRKGGKGGTDIYRFVLPEAKFMFVGSVRDFDEGTPMPGASVKIISSDGQTAMQKTEGDGLISLQLRPETDYLVVVTKPGYFNKKAKFSTKGLETITTLRDEFLMRSMAKAVEVEGVLYAFARWELSPESETALAELVEVLNDNPTITIEISAHTDSRGDTDFNIELSQKRAQSVVDYLLAHNIDASRLQAKGYGASMPRVVSRNTAAQYPKFLKEGDVLNDAFIYRVRSQEEEDLVDQLNRRTEFKVITK